ncbi:Mono(2-hydroxyethyl) terephthalate hydrolase [compost metagenome]
MQNGRAYALAAVPALIAVAGCGGGGSDTPGAPATNAVTASVAIAPVVSCASLNGKQFEDATVTSATPVAASGTLPAYCKVTATQNGTQHDIQVLLPDAWQDRYYQQGGGGFDGAIPNLTPAVDSSGNNSSTALRSGAMVLGNNGGHRDSTGADFLNNPTVVELYSHTAIGVARDFGDALAQNYYGKIPKYAYYEGCSNGGRGALNAAAKYGDKFNAVIAGAPTRNLEGQVPQWTRAAALSLPSADKLKQIASAAIAKCDSLDGVSDGVISNWQKCTFDPTADVPASVQLTSSEAAAVKALMTDLTLSNGTVIYSGYGFGDMSFWGPWYAGLGLGHMENIVLSNPTWDVSTFNVDQYFPTISSVLQTQYHFDAERNGLVQFLAAGKKIVIWHGSDDALLSHKDTIRTWQEVANGAGASLTQDNSRMYIAAGVNHCGQGPGADTFDLFTPTMNWVEKGTAPPVPVASKLSTDQTKTLFTRPLCTYPQYPQYKGSGDVNDATNFTCVSPT